MLLLLQLRYDLLLGSLERGEEDTLILSDIRTLKNLQSSLCTIWKRRVRRGVSTMAPVLDRMSNRVDTDEFDIERP